MGFDDLPEQKHVADLLQRSLGRGRLAHAYLFSGSSLAGLEDAARTLAKTLNCANPPRQGPDGAPLDSCDQCRSCQRIDAANHPDVLWVRAESKSRVIRIDQIRELLHTIYLKPTEAKYKVAVVVAVDRLNPQAANAFLKTLEEPPPRSILILLTTEPQRILETITSRCLRLNFAGERAGSDPKRMEWLSLFVDTAASQHRDLIGRYRLLGSLLAKLTDEKAAIEKQLSARSPLETFPDLDRDLREKFEDELSAAIEAEYRRQRNELLAGLEWWLRDLWLKTLGIGGQMQMFPELDRATAMIAGRISVAEALENIHTIEQTQRLLGSNVQEALALEVGLLRLAL